VNELSKVVLVGGLLWLGGGCSGSVSKSDNTATVADAKAACDAEADARKRCHGDYDGYASAEEYVSACVDDYGLSCGDADREAFRLLSQCETEDQCADDTKCTERALNQLATDHPERQTAAMDCVDRISACIDASDPEAFDSLVQHCLAYLSASAKGAAKLNACVGGNCEDLSPCLTTVRCGSGSP
jgi:hypothetical protein